MVAKVELNVAGTWTDISDPDLPDVQAPVTITRGRRDEQSRVSYGRCDLELRSKDAKYSIRHPASVFYGKIGRNTPIRVGVNPLSDDFDRTVVDGWGTSSSGHVWTVAKGAAANFDVDGSVGTITAASFTRQVATLPGSYGEVELLCKMRVVTLTGVPWFGLVANWADDSNTYRVGIDTTQSSSDTLLISRSSSGVSELNFGARVGSAEVTTVAEDTDYWLRASFGKRVRAKWWADSGEEPSAWQVDEFDDYSTGGDASDPLPRSGNVGVFLLGTAGNGAVIAVDDLTVDSFRFHGEVSEWPPKPYQGEDDLVTVPITASGILRRLSQSTTALRSPMYREATKASTLANAVAYWPMEDGVGATQFAAALPGVQPMTFTGTWTLATSNDFPGSKALPTLGDGANWRGAIPATPDTTGAVYLRCLMSFPSAGLTNATTIVNIFVTGGNVVRFGLVYGTGGNLTLQAVDADGDVVDQSVGAFTLDGERFILAVELEQDGDDCDIIVYAGILTDDNQLVNGQLNPDTLTGVTVGRAHVQTGGGAGTMDGCTVGHIGVGNDQDFLFGPQHAVLGNTGETAADRMVRIADDANIALQVVGVADDTTLMGAQVDGTALDVLQSCADADSGILYESRNELGLTYVTGRALYNQTGPELDYDAGHIVDLEPVDDDQTLVNDVTVTRVFGAAGRGSSARAVLESGPLSVKEPPDGVGTGYTQDYPVNVQYDAQLAGIATWKRHLGTWDEQRFRTIDVALASTAWADDPDLVAQVLALDTGSVVTAKNPPGWLPPDDIAQMVQGYTEVLGGDDPDEHDIDLTTTPSGPYRVFEVESPTGNLGRASTDRSTLESAATAGTDTSLSVTVDKGPLWITGTVDFNVVVAGAVLHVTNISGVASPQTMTVDQTPVNGVVKNLPAGAAVQLYQPPAFAL